VGRAPGLFPDEEPALYLAAVVLGLFQGALILLMLVFPQRRRRTASDPAALPATAGASAWSQTERSGGTPNGSGAPRPAVVESPRTTAPPRTARADRLMGDSTRSTGGDR